VSNKKKKKLCSYLDWFVQVTTTERMQGDRKLFPRWIQIIFDDLSVTGQS